MEREEASFISRFPSYRNKENQLLVSVTYRYCCSNHCSTTVAINRLMKKVSIAHQRLKERRTLEALWRKGHQRFTSMSHECFGSVLPRGNRPAKLRNKQRTPPAVWIQQKQETTILQKHEPAWHAQQALTGLGPRLYGNHVPVLPARLSLMRDENCLLRVLACVTEHTLGYVTSKILAFKILQT